MERKSKLRLKLKSQVNIISFNSSAFPEQNLHCHLGRRGRVTECSLTVVVLQSSRFPPHSMDCPSSSRRDFSQTLSNNGILRPVIRVVLITLNHTQIFLCLRSQSAGDEAGELRPGFCPVWSGHSVRDDSPQ